MKITPEIARFVKNHKKQHSWNALVQLVSKTFDVVVNMSTLKRLQFARNGVWKSRLHAVQRAAVRRQTVARELAAMPPLFSPNSRNTVEMRKGKIVLKNQLRVDWLRELRSAKEVLHTANRNVNVRQQGGRSLRTVRTTQRDIGKKSSGRRTRVRRR